MLMFGLVILSGIVWVAICSLYTMRWISYVQVIANDTSSRVNDIYVTIIDSYELMYWFNVISVADN